VIIDEAAGVTKYKQRRRQAERKMELTRQNLARVTDIVGEIERTRGSLKRQVAKAERFLHYRTELEDLVLHEASHKWLELTVVGRVEDEALETASGQVEEIRTRLRRAEDRLDRAREEGQAIEQRAEAASQHAFDVDNEASRLQAGMGRARDKLDHLSGRLNSIDTESVQVGERTTGLAGERVDLEARLDSLSGDENARAADVASEEEALAELRIEESAATDKVQQQQSAAAQVGRQAAAAEARLDGLAQRISEAHARRDRLCAEQEEHEGELTSLDARRQALTRSMAEILEGKRLTEAERTALEQEMQQLRGQLLDSERAVDSAKNELGLKRNRLRALEEVHRRHEGIGSGVRALLSMGHPSILGLVADRIEAPEQLTQAFAGLLGERLQWVIVDDMQQGLGLLGSLQSSERGRAHLVPARPRYVAGTLGSLGAAGDDSRILGYLSDQLSYAPEDEALVRTLVADAVLVKTAEDAMAVIAEVAGVRQVVALDGTVVRDDGSVSGGSGDDVASAMVEQRREMRLLAEQVESLTERFAEVAERHNTLRARKTELSTALERARQEAHEGELTCVSAEKDLAKTSHDIDRATARRRSLEAELSDLEGVLRAAEHDELAVSEELDTSRTQLEHLHHGLARSEAHAISWRERVAAQAALLTERKVRLAQVREQEQAAQAALERVVQSMADLTARAERLEQESYEAATSFGQTAAELMGARQASIETQASACEAHRNLDESRALLEQVRHALGTQEAELKQLRESLQSADDAARRAEMALQRVTLEHDHLLSVVRDRFRGLDLRRVVGDYHARPAPDTEHHRRIEELSQLIDRMGPVNLDAKSEFEDADRRFTELRSQKIDIEKALVELERAIKHMNRESRRRFRETFEAVNELFKRTFRRMFQGGRAELVLTDPEDLLGTGVEIVAQPPGKKLGNIDLMSGGEKALTAVSLLLAIFEHKPAPFCVLDEVDAPLDEPNVARYNEAIRSMTDRSQFIIITHVRKTMQMVDVLYGVTMGEPGVSRLVSVRVNENVTTRSDARASGLLRSTAPPRVDRVAGETQVA
jgi:chromosome segregation protein